MNAHSSIRALLAGAAHFNRLGYYTVRMGLPKRRAY